MDAVTWSAALAAALGSAAVAVWPYPAADARRRLRALTSGSAQPGRPAQRGRSAHRGRSAEPGSWAQPGSRAAPGSQAEPEPRGQFRGAAGRPTLCRLVGLRAGPLAGPRVGAGTAALGLALVVGGPAGLAVGLVVGIALDRGLRRLEPAAVRRRRMAVRSALPGAAELLAACLAAGAPIETATAAVARAVGGPLGRDLDSVLRAVHLGSAPVQAWTSAALDAELAPLAVALARASRGGAPPTEVLRGAAEELRDRRRTEASTAAQRVGVHAVAPLALCFLPAFVLLGVVPLVLALTQQLLGGSW